MSLKDFQMISKLGEGAYSTVHRVKRLIDNQEYAMKKVKLDNLTDKEKENALNEVRVLASINHPNIVAYKEAFIEKGSNYLYIIMEYADDGDLLAKIKDKARSQAYFPENQVWSIFIQVIQGLKVLHDLKILHRDIKSANVFLTKSGLVKLGDLNVAKMVKSLCQTQTGTPYYASPEIWKDEPYDKKSDMWSLGCVFYEVLALKPPFRANDMQGLYRKVVRGFYSRIPAEYSNDLNVLLQMLLKVKPIQRSSCDKLLEHPIVIKHLSCLPEEYIVRSFGSAELLRTININYKDKSNDLAKKIELPRPRYSSTIDVLPQDHTDTPRMKKGLHLPRIGNKVVDDMSLDLNQLQGKKKEPLRYREEPQSGRLKSQDRRVESHSPRVDLSAENSMKLYRGRLKQISPEVLSKILRKEREKNRVHSIIGTK